MDKETKQEFESDFVEGFVGLQVWSPYDRA